MKPGVYFPYALGGTISQVPLGKVYYTVLLLTPWKKTLQQFATFLINLRYSGPSSNISVGGSQYSVFRNCFGRNIRVHALQDCLFDIQGQNVYFSLKPQWLESRLIMRGAAVGLTSVRRGIILGWLWAAVGWLSAQSLDAHRQCVRTTKGGSTTLSVCESFCSFKMC